MTGVILDNINSIEDLRKLSTADLKELAIEVRHFIIDTLSQHPGHLASSLGTVELTLALHYVFNTPTTNSSGMWAIRLTPTKSLPAVATSSPPFALMAD